MYANGKKETREKLKMVAVHEFCHFMAIVYSVTAISIPKQLEKLMERLEKKVDRLDNDDLNRLYSSFSATDFFYKSGLSIYDDKHYRLYCEGKTVDYDILFNHFLFSKELFDEYFTEDKQKDFATLLQSDKTSGRAVDLFHEAVSKASDEKSVPFEMALHQAISWSFEYLEKSLGIK